MSKGRYGSALGLALACGCAAGDKTVLIDSGATARVSSAYGDSLTALGVVADSSRLMESPPPLPPVAPDTATPPATAATDDVPDVGGTLLIPVQGVRADDLRDTFDERRGGGARGHEAIDILAPRGTPVLAATTGRLLKLHSSVAGGLMVYEGDSTDRFILMYGHLDRYADGLRDGQPLRRGQVIGYVGTTGNANPATPHLHFAMARGTPSVKWWSGTPINPYPLLRPGGAKRP